MFISAALACAQAQLELSFKRKSFFTDPVLSWMRRPALSACTQGGPAQSPSPGSGPVQHASVLARCPCMAHLQMLWWGSRPKPCSLCFRLAVEATSALVFTHGWERLHKRARNSSNWGYAAAHCRSMTRHQVLFVEPPPGTLPGSHRVDVERVEDHGQGS